MRNRILHIYDFVSCRVYPGEIFRIPRGKMLQFLLETLCLKEVYYLSLSTSGIITEWSFGRAPDLHLLKFYQKYIPASNKLGLVK